MISTRLYADGGRRMSKTTAFWQLLIVYSTKKRLDVFGYLIYAQEKVNNHIISHILFRKSKF